MGKQRIEMEVRICQQCGVKIAQRPRVGKRYKLRRYCSHSCAVAASTGPKPEKLCPQCHRPLPDHYSPEQRRRAKYCSRECAQEAHRMPASELSPKTRYRSKQHRKVAAGKIGRPLRLDEQVHHINRDKLDNRPVNLEVVTAALHGKRHQFMPDQKVCEVCLETFTPHKTKRRRQKTCSWVCSRALAKRNNPMRRISETQRATIRARRASGEKLRSIGCDFGISDTTVSEIARGVKTYA